MKKTQRLIKENSYFTLYEVRTTGRTQFVFFRQTSTCLVEVKRMVGGGHTSTTKALNEFDRLTCVEAYKTAPLIA